MVFCLLVCWPEYDSACVIAPILLLPNVDGGGGIVQTQERRIESLHFITKVFASLLLDQCWLELETKVQTKVHNQPTTPSSAKKEGNGKPSTIRTTTEKSLEKTKTTTERLVQRKPSTKKASKKKTTPKPRTTTKKPTAKTAVGLKSKPKVSIVKTQKKQALTEGAAIVLLPQNNVWEEIKPSTREEETNENTTIHPE